MALSARLSLHGGRAPSDRALHLRHSSPEPPTFQAGGRLLSQIDRAPRCAHLGLRGRALRTDARAGVPGSAGLTRFPDILVQSVGRYSHMLFNREKSRMINADRALKGRDKHPFDVPVCQ